MKHHGILWYFVRDALGDARAWVHERIVRLRALLNDIYGDYGQAIALIQAEAAATAREYKVKS